MVERHVRRRRRRRKLATRKRVLLWIVLGAGVAGRRALAECAGGSQSRSFSVVTEDAHGGLPCAADHGEVVYRDCNTSPCPVDCVGSWGAYGACSEERGGCVRTRTVSRFQLGLRLEEQPVSSLLAQQIRSSARLSLVLCQWIVVASGGSGPNVRWSVAEALGCGRIKS